jgi:hypothetical protein
VALLIEQPLLGLLPEDRAFSVMRQVEQLVDSQVRGASGAVRKFTRYQHGARTTMDEVRAAPSGNKVRPRRGDVKFEDLDDEPAEVAPKAGAKTVRKFPW